MRKFIQILPAVTALLFLLTLESRQMLPVKNSAAYSDAAVIMSSGSAKIMFLGSKPVIKEEDLPDCPLLRTFYFFLNLEDFLRCNKIRQALSLCCVSFALTIR
ncbi:hypothetical protein M2347_003918 [Chryseobacterium sp. H1D6B]|uniref:hypothetical protein n=1 Tax=Chryseobacterium sp. H1D6B TaxID=2940588 RepID=UPI0015CE6293|nr:hypothetical protein [Chryseobacterium sp. H1D6B]MDH6254191.1 hypothetical protein [Chryseobacterium sp. H1D6B]